MWPSILVKIALMWPDFRPDFRPGFFNFTLKSRPGEESSRPALAQQNFKKKISRGVGTRFENRAKKRPNVAQRPGQKSP
jgi:hypothetical protein